uniref:Uncharacterized protein n=1 Tax=uncultured prokaryote TaxID=198431 RepID=A0A0H5Q485_9ZZZZ|nr:hypothetical protein [uncultured prokaryote]
MTLVIPEEYAEASIELRNDGDPDAWYITFGVGLGAAGVDVTPAAEAIYGAFSDNLKADLGDDTAIVACHLRAAQPTGDPITYSFFGTDSGTSSGDRLPQNCALLVTKVTGLGGRKGRGRMFVPNVIPVTGCNEVGVLDSTFRSAIQADFDGFLTDVDAITTPFACELVLLHNDYGVDTPAPTHITRLQVETTIATQRRRLRN